MMSLIRKKEPIKDLNKLKLIADFALITSLAILVFYCQLNRLDISIYILKKLNQLIPLIN